MHATAGRLMRGMWETSLGSRNILGMFSEVILLSDRF